MPIAQHIKYYVRLLLMIFIVGYPLPRKDFVIVTVLNIGAAVRYLVVGPKLTFWIPTLTMNLTVDQVI